MVGGPRDAGRCRLNKIRRNSNRAGSSPILRRNCSGLNEKTARALRNPSSRRASNSGETPSAHPESRSRTQTLPTGGTILNVRASQGPRARHVPDGAFGASKCPADIEAQRERRGSPIRIREAGALRAGRNEAAGVGPGARFIVCGFVDTVWTWTEGPAVEHPEVVEKIGRGGGIRTPGFLLPNSAASLRAFHADSGFPTALPRQGRLLPPVPQVAQGPKSGVLEQFWNSGGGLRAPAV